MILTLMTLSLLGDVAPWGPFKREPPPKRPQCSVDTDCELSTFGGCCGGCCGSDPHAIPKGHKEGGECAALKCNMPDCAEVLCAKPAERSSFVALCRERQCVALPKKVTPVECRENQDCIVKTAAPPAAAACRKSACGCCPVMRAVPVPPRKTANDSPPSGEKPPNCAPCPEATAGCSSTGRCVLLEPPRPRPPG